MTDRGEWRRDPTGRHAERLHDGVTWTKTVREHEGDSGIDPLPVHVPRTRQQRRLAELPHDALQALAELECLTDDDGLGHGTHDEPEFLRYRRILLACDDHEIAEVTARAVRDLRACRRRETPAVDRYDVRAVVLRECVDWSPTDVERSSHKASARSVRKWRVDAGRFPETGKVMPGAPGTTTEKVRALALEGKSVRVIAMTVGLPKSTVHDMLVQIEKAS